MSHHEIMDRVSKAIDDMQRMTHATVVVRAAAILEGELERCIKTKMRPLDKAMAKRLFENYGPLSSFAGKIDIAYALGITTPEINAELNKIRRTRNEFAHTTGPLSLDRDPIRPLFDALNRPAMVHDTDPAVFAEAFMEGVCDINDFLERYLFRMGVTEGIADRNKVPGTVPQHPEP